MINLNNMSSSSRSLGIIWRIMRWLNPRILGRFRSAGKQTELVLVLSNVGRKTGVVHETPLQYELVDGLFYIASARGQKADWYRNIRSNPEVTVEIEGKKFPARAEGITDPVKIADFFELRLRRHPGMIKILLWLEGLPINYTRAELEKFAEKKAIVALHPLS